MKQYEIIYESTTKKIEEKLNELSKRGYEFVSSNVGANGLLVIMCRENSNESDND